MPSRRLGRALLCACLASFAAGAADPILYRAERTLRPAPERFITPTVDEPAILNPPGFRWAAEPGASYDLEVARKPDFSACAIRGEGLTWNLYTPERALESGNWYWRTRSVKGTAKGPWSEAREFALVAGLPSIPAPSAEELLKRARAAGHPRLYVNRASLPQLRDAARGSRRADWAQFEKGLPAARRFQAVEPVVPLNISEADPATAAIANKVRSHVLAASASVQALALSYLMGDNEADGAAARKLLLELAAWDPEGSTNCRRNDRAFRPVVQALTRGYDWLAGTKLLTADDRAKIESAATARGRDFMAWYERSKVSQRWPFESHASGGLGNFGEMAAAFAGSIPEAGEWLRYWTFLITANYPAYGRSDGSWSEGPSYWKWTMDYQVSSMAAISSAFGIPFTAHPYLANTGYFKLYSNPPWAKLSPFGDALTWRPDSLDASVMARLAETYQEPSFAWYATVVEGADTKQADSTIPAYLRTGRDATRAMAARAEMDRLPKARLFPDGGLAALRTHLTDESADVQFLIKSSPLGSVSHAYADQGAFYLAAYGEPLAIDTGYYNGPVLYGSPSHATWNWQSWAHNVPLVDGHGQGSRSALAAGRIEHFYHSDAVDFVAADMTRAYQAASEQHALRIIEKAVPELARFSGSAPVVAAVRSVVFLRPDVFVICDDFTARRPVRFDWLLHAYNRFETDDSLGTALTAARRASLSTQLFADDAVRFSQTDEFPIPLPPEYPKLWHLKGTPAGERDRHRVVAVLAPLRPGTARPAVRPLRTGNSVGVEIERGGRRVFVAFATPKAGEAPVVDAIPGMRIAGRAAALDERKAPWLYAAGAAGASVGRGSRSKRFWNFSAPVDFIVRGATMSVNSTAGFTLNRTRFPAGHVSITVKD